jgi:gluconokinase
LTGSNISAAANEHRVLAARAKSRPGPIPRAGRVSGVILLVMGVSGSGKTTVGTLLAERLGWPYADADSFHPAGNVAKMRGGVPLGDEDRWPWLEAMAAWMDREIAAGRSAVTSGSALKRAYRDLLRRDRPQLRIVYLEGDRELVGARLTSRKGHFFPVTLLDSQFRELEPPAPDEGVLTVSAAGTPARIPSEIIERLELESAAM